MFWGFGFWEKRRRNLFNLSIEKEFWTFLASSLNSVMNMYFKIQGIATRSPSSSSTKNSRPHQQKLRLLLTTDVASWVSGFRVMWRYACRIFSGWLQAKNIFMLTLSSMTSLLIAHLSDQKWQMHVYTFNEFHRQAFWRLFRKKHFNISSSFIYWQVCLTTMEQTFYWKSLNFLEGKRMYLLMHIFRNHAIAYNFVFFNRNTGQNGQDFIILQLRFNKSFDFVFPKFIIEWEKARIIYIIC